MAVSTVVWILFLALSFIAAAVWALKNVFVVMPSKGMSLIETSGSQCETAQVINDNIHNKLHGDFDEDHLIERTFGELQQVKVNDSRSVFEGDGPVQADGGFVDAEPTVSDTGGGGTLEADVGAVDASSGQDEPVDAVHDEGK